MPSQSLGKKADLVRLKLRNRQSLETPRCRGEWVVMRVREKEEIRHPEWLFATRVSSLAVNTVEHLGSSGHKYHLWPLLCPPFLVRGSLSLLSKPETSLSSSLLLPSITGQPSSATSPLPGGMQSPAPSTRFCPWPFSANLISESPCLLAPVGRFAAPILSPPD